MSAEPARTTTSAKGRTILRPRFTVGTPDLVRIEPGRTLICPARPGQRVQITELARDGEDATIVVLEVTQGMGTPRKPKAGAVPSIGEQITTPSTPGTSRSASSPPPSQTPWTHGGPPQQPPAARRMKMGDLVPHALGFCPQAR